MTPLERYDTPTYRLRELREEARKRWDHFSTDEFIYFVNCGEGDVSTGAGQLNFERYRLGRLWLEVFCLLSCDGVSGEYAAICEADLDGISAENNSGYGKSGAVNDESMMFVGDIKFSERPQAVPSVVRLEGLDRVSSLLVKIGRRVEKLPRVRLWKQGEGGASIGRPRLAFGSQIFHGETIGDVIERGPKIMDAISQDKRPWDQRGRSERLVVKFCRSFRICITPTGFILIPIKGGDLIIKEIQVALRPLELKSGAIEWARFRRRE